MPAGEDEEAAAAANAPTPSMSRGGCEVELGSRDSNAAAADGMCGLRLSPGGIHGCDAFFSIAGFEADQSTAREAVSAADSGAAPEPPTGTCTGGNNSGPSGGDSSVAMLDAAGAGPGEQQGRSLPCVVWGTTKLDAFKLCVNRHCGCFQVHQQRVEKSQ